MKSKKISFKFLILQLVALTGLLLTQGCATGQCPIGWLNWPYDTPTEKPLIYPADDYTTDVTDTSILLPPDAYTSAPFETPDTYVPYETTDVPVAAASQGYVVKKGDTLSAIASMYGTSWKKLAAYNNLSNPNKLFVGQTISIPEDLDVVTTPVARASTPTVSVGTSGALIAQGSSYVIQRGDTLSGIATRSGLTVAEIKAANALANNRIVAGKSLSIPKKGEVNVDAYSAPVFDPVPAVAPMAGLAPIADLAPAADLAPVATSASAPVYEHVLYPGETIEDVARQYGSSQEEILLLNGISDPSVIKPGAKLLVPIPE